MTLMLFLRNANIAIRVEQQIYTVKLSAKMASLLGRLLLTVVSTSLWALCAAQAPVKSDMRSFSNAIKSGILVPGVELTLYESNTGEPGVITEQWFTGIRDPKECVKCMT